MLYKAYQKKLRYIIKNMSGPSFLAVNLPDVDVDQQTGGDKAGIPVPVIAGGVGGLVLLIVVIVLIVVFLGRK